MPPTSPRLTSLALGCALAAATLTLGAGPLGTGAAAADTAHDSERLEVAGFLGEHRIPPGTQFAGTTVGGFSGLDFDALGGTWYVVSDDRSALQPARFYTARLDFDATLDGRDGALSGVELTGTTPFLQPDGTVYPPLSVGDGTTPDPEDIRLDPISGRLLWSQEGERIVPADGSAATLIDPTVRFARLDGSFISELAVPQEQRSSAGQSGIMQNLGPEGLAFADGGRLVVTALEGPLLQDAAPATQDDGTLSRIVLQDRWGDVEAEYVYPQEPIFAYPVPADGFANTGVTSILAIDQDDTGRYLVMERSFVTGVGNRVQIFEVDTDGATDISGIDDGTGGTAVDDAEPVRKRLLLDVADLPVESVDNIEGMAWGPEREDGERTLVLVSDDNFTASQVTQFIAVAVR